MITMCERCDDYALTVALFGSLSQYANRPGADAEFIDVTADALAASLPFEASINGPEHGGPEYPTGDGWAEG